MNSADRAMLESEIGMLEEMLERIDEGRVIERVGLEARVKGLREELAALPQAAGRVGLTFRGDPVIENRSILAEFAGKAAALFSEAVATVSASLSAHLGSAGPLPQGAERQLRIVGTAIGSFGFELELPQRDPQLLPGLLPGMNDAIEATIALIHAAQAGEEDQLSELIADTHSRAAAKVRAFVEHVVDRNAGFSIRFGDRRADIVDAKEGRAVLEALRPDQILQQETALQATLIGVLPDSRRFEVRRADTGEVLRGRIGREAGDPTELLHMWLDRPARLELRETRVRSAHPSYVLLGIRSSEE